MTLWLGFKKNAFVFVCFLWKKKWYSFLCLFPCNCYAEIVTSLLFEILFYIGIATFLLVTDRVQRPYLQFSSKRWGLITGLRGYLTCAFCTMGFKVIAPLFAVYVTWPMIGLPGLVAVVPFLMGFVAQLAFEKYLDKSGSSCWPLIPIIFEVHGLLTIEMLSYVARVRVLMD